LFIGGGGSSCRGQIILNPKAVLTIFVSLQAIKTRSEELSREIELLEQKLQEMEKLARGRGLIGFFNFRLGNAGEDIKSKSN